MNCRGFEPVCSNDDCRKRFSDLGLTYSDITEGDILTLIMLLNREIKKSNRAGETSVSTTYLSSKKVIKKKSNGTITEAYHCHCENLALWKPIPCPLCGGALSEVREHNGKRYRHCYACHAEVGADGKRFEVRE